MAWGGRSSSTFSAYTSLFVKADLRYNVIYSIDIISKKQYVLYKATSALLDIKQTFQGAKKNKPLVIRQTVIKEILLLPL